MADPRFYDNCGPFSLADVCAKTGAALPEGVHASLTIDDVASLSGAGATHLSFFSGSSKDAGALAASQAGFVLIPAKSAKPAPLRDGAVGLSCGSVQHAFAAAARLFYPEFNFTAWEQQTAIDRTAEIGEDVILGPGVVIGPGAEIGDGTRIGANTVIGRGVAVGRNCEISSNVSIGHAYIGDEVVIFPGAQIGAPGFGFASGASGHIKIPQLGRVIVQDRVEIGSCTTIDRGALGDTVVGEGTKIDNLVQIGHNTRIGRHCVIVSQVGISGSCEIGDFVVLGGQVGIADHCRIGTGARLAARAAMASGQDLPGGHDYGGVPAKPAKEWMREIYTLSKLTKKPKRDDNG